MTRSLARALLDPQTIAIYGASADASKHTSRPQRYLRQHGFTGRLVPINPRRTEVFGEPAFPDLRSANVRADHAFVMLSTANVVQAVRECGELGVPVVTVLSDGFAETGEAGRQRQEDLVRIAREGNVRIIGPNCLGVVNTHAGVVLCANAMFESDHLIHGSLGLISQSGSMLGSLFSRARARNIGFSKMISVGNEADVGVGELVDMLVDDPQTEAILLFLEALRDAPRLAHAARRAHAAGKPVIAYKLGRSRVGSTLSATHTGAMAGSDEAAAAFFRDNGIVRVNVVEGLLEIAPLLKGVQPRRRNRVAVMTTTGGGAATVVDPLGLTGVEIVPPTAAVRERLQQQGITIADAPIIDLTMAGTQPETASAVLAALLESDHCDIVVHVVGASGELAPGPAVVPVIEAPKLKPLAVYISPHAVNFIELLRVAGITAFRTPEACADAVRALAFWEPPSAVARANTEEEQALDRLRRLVKGGRSGALTEVAARDIFSALGVPQAQSEFITDAAAPVSLSYPVALKVVAAQVQHKTEVGGVALNISDASRLQDAARSMLVRVRAACPGAAIEGFLVQEMQRGICEAIVGYRHDRDVGPVVMLGAGGTLAEIYHDFTLRLAPVSLEEAIAMIGEVKGLALVRGYRGAPQGDLQALAAIIRAVSLLALTNGRVLEAELNPVIISRNGEGAVAVDALVSLA